jgi:hypothetical protein
MDRFEQFAHKVLMDMALLDMALLPDRKCELLAAALREAHRRGLEEKPAEVADGHRA